MKNPFYEPFRGQPWIQELAKKEKWTICDNQKIPVDMYGIEYLNRIFGAKTNTPHSLCTLDRLYEVVPNASNFDFYLQASADEIVVLDIEPICPEQIKKTLLKLPALYVEESMSGKGIHMVFPYPRDIVFKMPEIQNRVVLKPRNKYYEILLNHFVTFTGRPIPHTPELPMENFRKLFKALGSLKRRSGSGERLDIQIQKVEELKPKDCPVLDLILMYLTSEGNRWTKITKPSHYHDDLSTYEYCHMIYLDKRLDSILKISDIQDMIKKRPLTINERSWCVYMASTKTLPGRKKHETSRNCGSIRVPWLLYTALKAVSYQQTHPDEEEEDID